MTYVQSFSAVTPPPRYDSIAWTELEILESETENGTYVLIDTQAIALDATPATPDTVAVTTTLAEFAVGWYQFRFKDDVPNYSNYTAPVAAPAGSDGSVYFTVDELRERYPDDVGNEDTYSDAEVQAAIAAAVQAYEGEVGHAFQPRTAIETITELVDARTIRLPHRYVRSITSATGDVAGSIDITEARIRRRLVTIPDAWPADENIVVEYEHGLDEPPLRTIQAVQVLARSWLINGPVDSRRTQVQMAEGGVINLSTPGMFGATFGIPEVDATLEHDKGWAVA